MGPKRSKVEDNHLSVAKAEASLILKITVKHGEDKSSIPEG